MADKPTVLVYFSDNGEADLYNLTREQFDKLMSNDDWDTIEKFRIPAAGMWDDGYAPDYLLELAKIFGFEVDSI